MKVSRCIYPYEYESRELLMAEPLTEYKAMTVTITCDKVLSRMKKGRQISRGTCLGYKGKVPVYASLEGRIADIIPRKESYEKTVYDILVCREKHGKMLWTEIPFFSSAGGDYFLNQLGLKGKGMSEMKTVCIDGTQQEAFGIVKYRLLMEQTAKVILGADILGRCYKAAEIIFLIEDTWQDAGFILNKYIRKYKPVLKENTDYFIRYIPRSYPVFTEIKRPGGLFEVQTALYAYHGFYEHEPAVNTWLTAVGKNGTFKNFKTACGTAAGLLTGGEEQDRLVIGGPMRGKAAPKSVPVTAEAQQLCIFNKEALPKFYGSINDCIGCNLCEKSCPVKVTPFYHNKKTIQKCTGCNICSYVCPAHIPLGELIRRNALRREKSDRQGKGKKHDLWEMIKVKSMEEIKSGKKTKDRKIAKGQYIELADDGTVAPALIQSDAPPHIHSGNRSSRAYLYWLLALIPPALLTAAASGWPAAKQMLLSVFFVVSFHEILSGFFPGTFSKVSPLKAAADGLMIAVLIPPSAAFSGIAGLELSAVALEKFLLKYRLTLNTPAAVCAAVLTIFCGDSAALAYPAYNISFILIIMLAFIFLWGIGYLYGTPFAVTAVFQFILLRQLPGFILFCAVFLTGRWQSRGISYSGQTAAAVLSVILTIPALLFLNPAAAVCAGTALGQFFLNILYSGKKTGI